MWTMAFSVFREELHLTGHGLETQYIKACLISSLIQTLTKYVQQSPFSEVNKH